MWEVMNCCVILRNMIIESEKADPIYDYEPYLNQGPLVVVDHQIPSDWTAYLNMRQEIRDPHVHRQPQEDLVDHLWMAKTMSSLIFFCICAELCVCNIMLCAEFAPNCAYISCLC